MARQENGLCLALTGDECPCVPSEKRCDAIRTDHRDHDDQCGAVLCGLEAHRARLASSLSGWIEPADVDDLVQEAFLRALTRPMEFRGRRSMSAWLRRVVRNLAIDHIRHEGAEQRARAGLARDRLVQGVTTPELSDRRTTQDVLALVEEIGLGYAEVIRRVDLEDASIEDVAVELGLTKGNVRVRLHRGRARLREQWSRRRRG